MSILELLEHMIENVKAGRDWNHRIERVAGGPMGTYFSPDHPERYRIIPEFNGPFNRSNADGFTDAQIHNLNDIARDYYSPVPSADGTPFMVVPPMCEYFHTDQKFTKEEYIKHGWSEGQLVAAGHGKWVAGPAPAIPGELPKDLTPVPPVCTRRAILKTDVLEISDDIELSAGLRLALRDVTDRAGLNLYRTERKFWFDKPAEVKETKITLEEVFNAPNGLDWPKWAVYLEISDKSYTFVGENTANDNAKISIPRK